jgi:hypothetical protein
MNSEANLRKRFLELNEEHTNLKQRFEELVILHDALKLRHEGVLLVIKDVVDDMRAEMEELQKEVSNDKS